MAGRQLLARIRPYLPHRMPLPSTRVAKLAGDVLIDWRLAQNIKDRVVEEQRRRRKDPTPRPRYPGWLLRNGDVVSEAEDPVSHESDQEAPAIPSAAVLGWDTSEDGFIVLACVPAVVPDVAFAVQGSFALNLIEPLQVSTLTVPRGMSTKEKTPGCFPFVAAVGEEAKFLLYAPMQPQGLNHQNLDFLDIFHRNPKQSDSLAHANAAYCLCDARTGAATLLPPTGRPLVPLSVGIAANADATTAAELHVQARIRRATLLIYSTSTQAWSRRVMLYPMDRQWTSNTVLVKGDALVWVDYSLGFLEYDLSHPGGPLRFTALPEGCDMPQGTRGLEKHRCASICDNGKLHYVQINIEGEEPGLSVWSYDEERQTWMLKHAVKFNAIWGHASYRDTGLPEEIPTVVFVHPLGVPFFILHSVLFGINCASGSIAGWEVIEMVHPPPEYQSATVLRLWHLPEGDVLDDTQVRRGLMTLVHDHQ